MAKRISLIAAGIWSIQKEQLFHSVQPHNLNLCGTLQPPRSQKCFYKHSSQLMGTNSTYEKEEYVWERLSFMHGKLRGNGVHSLHESWQNLPPPLLFPKLKSRHSSNTHFNVIKNSQDIKGWSKKCRVVISGTRLDHYASLGDHNLMGSHDLM